VCAANPGSDHPNQRQEVIRESDVARLALRGLSTTAIADILHTSTKTVQDHLKAVFDKTAVHNRRDLVGRFLATAKPSP